MLKLKYKQFFLLPGLIVLVAIIIFPLLFTIRVSFSSWDVVKPGLDWYGGKNWGRLFEDMRFWESLTRLSLMAIGSVLIQYLLGFGLALLVWRDIILKTVYPCPFSRAHDDDAGYHVGYLANHSARVPGACQRHHSTAGI